MSGNFLHWIDIYGGHVGFTFRGKGSYTSVCGGMCSVLTFLVLIFFYTVKTVDFIGQIDPQYSMVESVLHTDESIDLYSPNYRFAIRKLDRRYGVIQLVQYSRYIDDEAGLESVQEYELPMVPCNEIEDEGDEFNIFTSENIKEFREETL